MESTNAKHAIAQRSISLIHATEKTKSVNSWTLYKHSAFYFPWHAFQSCQHASAFCRRHLHIFHSAGPAGDGVWHVCCPLSTVQPAARCCLILRLTGQPRPKFPTICHHHQLAAAWSDRPARHRSELDAGVTRALLHFTETTRHIDSRFMHRWIIVFNCGCPNTHRGWRTPIPNQTNTHSQAPTPTTPIRVFRIEKIRSLVLKPVGSCRY